VYKYHVSFGQTYIALAACILLCRCVIAAVKNRRQLLYFLLAMVMATPNAWGTRISQL